MRVEESSTAYLAFFEGGEKCKPGATDSLGLLPPHSWEQKQWQGARKERETVKLRQESCGASTIPAEGKRSDL